jgi:NADPH-dependent 2,4-dienoyl-CoA reductase/sulfur reductase-like enzyme
MCTTIPEVYAAGDCAETLDLISKKPTYVPIGSIAAQQGRIAGINAAGGSEKSDGFLRVQSDNPFGVEITSIGHGSTMAGELGIKSTVQDIKFPSTAGIISPFSSNYPIRAKVITNQLGKVIGGQTVGARFSAQYSWAIIKAIRERMTLKQLRKQLTLPIKNMVDCHIF